MAPVYFVGFPAILKGWIERGLSLGFAFGMTPEAWRGDLNGRISLLTHEKALIIQTTIWNEASYVAGLRAAMKLFIDDYALRYPGIKRVEHTAGLPGGISNTGGECGGITALLILLGLRHGLESDGDGLPVVIAKGRDLLQRFAAFEASLPCREIRGDARVSLKLCPAPRVGWCLLHPPPSQEGYRPLGRHAPQSQPGAVASGHPGLLGSATKRLSVLVLVLGQVAPQASARQPTRG